MLRGEIDADEADTTADLRRAYAAALQETVERVGPAVVAERSGVDSATIAAIREGEVGDVSLVTAAAVLATDPERPDGQTIAAEARDLLLLGMTTAVVDVDTLASSMDGRMEPKEIQQMLEGRHPMTLDEYAAIHYHLREHVE